MADKDKERYENEMKDYSPSEEFLAKKAASPTTKSKKVRVGPKRALSS